MGPEHVAGFWHTSQSRLGPMGHDNEDLWTEHTTMAFMEPTFK